MVISIWPQLVKLLESLQIITDVASALDSNEQVKNVLFIIFSLTILDMFSGLKRGYGRGSLRS